MDDALGYPHKTEDYSYRVPTPPRIVIPPPTLNDEAFPEITLRALKSADFLNSVDHGDSATQKGLLEWDYECRREAQLILPYLYLGPMTAAKDEAFLRGCVRRSARTGQAITKPAGPITMILGIRQRFGIQNKLMSGVSKKADQMGITAHTVDLASNQELIQTFPKTTALINNHLAEVYQETGKLGRVLVFCESGNERSAGVVAAYLMETHVDVDYIKAIQLVQAQRFCANFDDSMKGLLQGYWDIVAAKRQVAADVTPRRLQILGDDTRSSAYTSQNKRSLSRDEDDVMSGVEADDMDRFVGREFQPFKDRYINLRCPSKRYQLLFILVSPRPSAVDLGTYRDVISGSLSDSSDEREWYSNGFLLVYRDSDEVVMLHGREDRIETHIQYGTLVEQRS
nr:serine/threonine/tyrosine-interacting protein [Quercus suber]